MVSFPPCKINLGLQILFRQADGYHAISTCFYPLPLTDALEILPGTSFAFHSSGIPIPGSGEENLCVKAFHLMKEQYNLPPVQIHLHKIIPTGAGLGGGSSDAAHTLRLLNSVFELKLSQQRLMELASQLGSDCPFFIQDDPMLGSNRGDRLSPIALHMKGYYLVLLTPDIHVSTQEAYAGATAQQPKQTLPAILGKPVSMWRNELINDFETTVFKKFPHIKTLKESLYRQGAIYSGMSGSGSSVFGIFEKEVKLEGTLRNVLGWSGWL